MSSLADQLAPHYTVVTYDRRGISRSKLDDPAEVIEVKTHSEDASRLLCALTTEPALVLGISLGALIGLDLVARHPDQVRLLVAHEPPLTELLSEAERTAAERARDEVMQMFERQGLAAAMRKFLAMAGVDVENREADLEIPRPSPQRAVNFTFFLTRDSPAARRYRLDIDALKAVASKVVPAVGRDSERKYPHRCALALGLLLDREAAAFPGDHSGPVLRPQAFAARLREVLGDSQAKT
jgi:pimeloyl-ACP methyl ester carboxylesterase